MEPGLTASLPTFTWVAEAYGIGAVHAVESLGGGSMPPFRLQADKGSYVLRAGDRRLTEPRLTYLAATVEQVTRCGVYGPRILRHGEGGFLREHEGAFWTLHEYVAGTGYDWERWHAAKSSKPYFLATIGRQVAALHDALRESSAGGDQRLDPGLPPIQFGRIKDQRRKWRDGLNRLEMNPGAPARYSRERLLAARAALDEAWSRLEEEAVKLGVDRLPKQTVHGAISPASMVFRPDGLHFTLVDWDRLYPGPRLYDALGDMLNRRPASAARSLPFEIGEVRDYLLGYAAATTLPLSDAELAAVPAFCRARQLEDLRRRLDVLAQLPAEQDVEWAALIDMRLKSLETIQRKMTARWL